MKVIRLLLCFGLFSLIYCQPNERDASSSTAEPSTMAISDSIPDSPSPTSRLIPEPDKNELYIPQHNYSWLPNLGNNRDRLIYRIAPPAGFERIPEMEESFASWLRYLPLKAKGSSVLLYNGNPKGNQSAQYAVLNMDTGKRDLQQCADAVMRLRAEYFYMHEEFEKIHFNYTSGHKVAFSDWSQGRKPKVNGNSVTFSPKKGSVNTTYANFRDYLISVFNYAGTASLSKEMKKVPIKEMQIGDVFIQGGFPGHAIIVIDMVENEIGEKQFMLAQSYMPAQDIHILKNPSASKNTPWYPLSFGDDLLTPEWDFRKEDLKRFQ